MYIQLNIVYRFEKKILKTKFKIIHLLEITCTCITFGFNIRRLTSTDAVRFHFRFQQGDDHWARARLPIFRGNRRHVGWGHQMSLLR